MYSGFQSSNIIWVPGMEGANAHMLGPSSTALLMDSMEKTFYIKSTDSIGMPLPMRIFDYTERIVKAESKDNSIYIAKEDVDKQLAQLREEFENRLQELVAKKTTRKEKADE